MDSLYEIVLYQYLFPYFFFLFNAFTPIKATMPLENRGLGVKMNDTAKIENVRIEGKKDRRFKKADED